MRKKQYCTLYCCERITNMNTIDSATLQILKQSTVVNTNIPPKGIINYNEKFKNAKPILYRDTVIDQTLSVLISKKKPNVLLIGAAGTGKTKIAEDIARKLANDEISFLKGYTLWELPISNLVAGAYMSGEVEQNVQDIIDFAVNNKVILFIDEIHLLVSNNNQYKNIAEIIKPALTQGNMKVIGATTIQEGKQFDNNPALKRRFSKVIVNELTTEQTIEILKMSKVDFMRHYKNKIIINDDVLIDVARIADQYINSHRPDNAITLLDRTMGNEILNRSHLEQQARTDNMLANALKAVPVIKLTSKAVKTTALRLVGYTEQNSSNADAIKTALSVIKGQDEIIDKIATILRNRDKGLFTDEKRPLAFMFAGPSGVGKTEMVKQLATVLMNTKPIILNMTEYDNHTSINRIIGSPAGYVGYDSQSELPFDILETNPYQVILLDEFEKCHPTVQKLFMSVLDEGTLSTNKNGVINFSKSIIIATTNAANDDTVHRTIGFNTSQQSNRQQIIDTLLPYFDTALLNRFGENVFMFNGISLDTYKNILQSKYKTEILRIKTINKSITLPDELPNDIVDDIAKDTYVPQFGARPAYNAVKSYIENNA